MMTELTPKQRATLELLDQGEEYQNYFFQKVRGLRWFHPLRERGFFGASRNPSARESTEPGFYTIPHWVVLDYLESAAAECGSRADRPLAEELLQILRDVTRPKVGKAADNYRTWWYFGKIMRQLPTAAVRATDIDMIDVWLESRFGTSLLGEELGERLLPKFLESTEPEDWDKGLRIVEIATRIRWAPRAVGMPDEKEAFTRIEPHWLRNLFKRNSERIGQQCGEEGPRLMARRLRETVVGSGDEYSYIWRAAVEDHRHNHERESARDVLVSALRDVGLSFVRTKGAESLPALDALLIDESRTVRRVGIHLVDAEYETLKNAFWSRLDPGFFELPYRHELFLLLRHYFQGFGADEKSRVISLIARLTGDWVEGVDRDTLDAALRLEWLESIRGQGSAEADSLYRKMQAIAKFSSEHPEFPSYSETSVGWGESPLGVEDLLARPITEIVGALRDFRERRDWKAPTAGGLAEVLKRALVTRQEKFELDLERFREVQPTYLAAIFEGFEELWKAKKRIAWERVLDFALVILRDPAFWTRDPGVGDTFWLATTPESVVSAIVGLVEEGVRDDAWAFDEVHLPKAEQIIGLALEHIEPSATGESGDALTEAYNTVRGQSLRALINYSLRRARIVGTRNEDKGRSLWEQIRGRFEGELERCQNANIEFSALAGAHLPNLYYLSHTWVERNIDRIFPVEYERNWRAAIEGFSFVSTFNRNLYLLLRDRGHLARALEFTFKNDSVREQLIRTVAIGYLLDLEALEGESLFAKILREWRPDDISEIIWFFWGHHEGRVDDSILRRILAFWGQCYLRIGGHESENAPILSDLNVLAALLDSVDDMRLRWLLMSAPYVEVKYHSPLFLEYLERLASLSPRAVAQIIIKMLTRATPTYDPDHIRSIVTKLYDAGLTEEADSICNEYAKRTQGDLLRDIYERRHG